MCEKKELKSVTGMKIPMPFGWTLEEAQYFVPFCPIRRQCAPMAAKTHKYVVFYF